LEANHPGHFPVVAIDSVERYCPKLAVKALLPHQALCHVLLQIPFSSINESNSLQKLTQKKTLITQPAIKGHSIRISTGKDYTSCIALLGCFKLSAFFFSYNSGIHVYIWNWLQ
jgi:hypothetical protein